MGQSEAENPTKSSLVHSSGELTAYGFPSFPVCAPSPPWAASLAGGWGWGLEGGIKEMQLQSFKDCNVAEKRRWRRKWTRSISQDNWSSGMGGI